MRCVWDFAEGSPWGPRAWRHIFHLALARTCWLAVAPWMIIVNMGSGSGKCLGVSRGSSANRKWHGVTGELPDRSSTYGGVASQVESHAGLRRLSMAFALIHGD